MAKVILGESVAAVSGSTGSTTWSHNRGGVYKRRRAIPVNPQTTDQQDVRDTLSSLAKAWASDLTQLQRDGWTAFATANPTTDVLGQALTLTGLQMYASVNSRLEAAVLPRIDTAPANTAVDSILTFDVTITVLGTVMTAAFTATPLAANMHLQIIATPQLSPGISFVKGKTRLIQTFAAATISPADFEAAWLAKFGSFPVATTKVVVFGRIINDLNGAISQELRDDVIVA